MCELPKIYFHRRHKCRTVEHSRYFIFISISNSTKRFRNINPLIARAPVDVFNYDIPSIARIGDTATWYVGVCRLLGQIDAYVGIICSACQIYSTRFARLSNPKSLLSRLLLLFLTCFSFVVRFSHCFFSLSLFLFCSRMRRRRLFRICSDVVELHMIIC